MSKSIPTVECPMCGKTIILKDLGKHYEKPHINT